MKPLIIGIAGGTGSGKTTLVNRLLEQFGEDISVLPHDSYYAAHHELTLEERCIFLLQDRAVLITMVASLMWSLFGWTGGKCWI